MLAATDLGGDGQAKVDPRRDAAAGDDVAVDHHSVFVRNGAELLEELARRPMTGRALALEQPRRPQHQGTGAHRGDVARPGRQPLHLGDIGLVQHGVGGARPAGDADQVAALDLGQAPYALESQAVTRVDRAAFPRGEDHLRPRNSGQHFPRPCEIELGQVGEQGEDDDEGLVGHGLRRPSRATSAWRRIWALAEASPVRPASMRRSYDEPPL